MRSITSAVLIGFLVLAPCFALRAADKQKPSTLEIEATLRDGSRVKGEIVPNRPLRVTSPMMGEVSIALSKVASITFGDSPEQATLHLSNGDTLQGTMDVKAVSLTTLFGPVKIPLSVVKELDLHSDESGTDKLTLNDWEPMPFPEDSGWPGDRGAPAIIENGVLTLRGRTLRATRTCTSPVTIECDIVLEDPQATDPGFFVYFLRPDQSRTSNRTGHVYAGLTFAPRVGEIMRCTPTIGSQDRFGHPRDLWRGTPFVFEAGKVYHLKLRATASDMTFSLDETEYQIPDVGIPFPEFLLELWGWQPTNVWLVKHLRVY